MAPAPPSWPKKPRAISVALAAVVACAILAVLGQELAEAAFASAAAAFAAFGASSSESKLRGAALRGRLLRAFETPAQSQGSSAGDGEETGWSGIGAGLAAGCAAVAMKLWPRAAKASTRGRLRLRLAGEGAAGAAPKIKAEDVPVWVINLDKSTQRWEDTKGECDKQNIKAERFSATYGKMLPDEEYEAKTTSMAYYFCSPGMVGCFLSHRRIWQRVVDEGQPAAIAFEDDVVIGPDFHQRLGSILEELPEDWDICLLGAVGCVTTDVEPIPMKFYGYMCGGTRAAPGKSRNISENLFVPYKPLGTHAYMVSQKGAKKLLELLPKATYHVDLAAYSLQDINLYCAKEHLARQRFDDDSTVAKSGEPLTEKWLKWLWKVSGIAELCRRGGVDNPSWAWKVAVFALPVLGSRKRIVVEAGPASSLFCFVMLLGLCTRRAWVCGAAIIYYGIISSMIRTLSGTGKRLRTVLIHGILGFGLIAFSARSW
eukprot:TRINITY_DN67143_c0_g2_i1.p1 TRINITY_DN67143_c0_g2~~TRINITY_DN67143_c0_g2_i1.p1  ORF type:complete len:509 (-),score=114.95 TRINITY_DN67143_c0_g2_i1:120-1577(-)